MFASRAASDMLSRVLGSTADLYVPTLKTFTVASILS